MRRDLQPETRRGRARFSPLRQRRPIAGIHRRSSPRCSSIVWPRARRWTEAGHPKGRTTGRCRCARGGTADPCCARAGMAANAWLDVAVKHHAPPIRRPTRRAHLAPHTRYSIDKLEAAFGSAAGVGDAIRRHEPWRPLFAGTGGQHAAFVGREIDRGNLRDATLSGDADDLLPARQAPPRRRAGACRRPTRLDCLRTSVPV